MTFSGIKRISLAQGKKILKVCTDPDLSEAEKILQCINIYSGAKYRDSNNENGKHLKAVYLQLLRLILPENILPVNCRYINTAKKLYELDLDAVSKSLENEDGIPDDIEKLLADHCVRFRYQGHGFKWELVTDKEAAAKDLLTANWRDVASSYLYLKTKKDDPAMLAEL